MSSSPKKCVFQTQRTVAQLKAMCNIDPEEDVLTASDVHVIASLLDTSEHDNEIKNAIKFYLWPHYVGEPITPEMSESERNRIIRRALRQRKSQKRVIDMVFSARPDLEGEWKENEQKEWQFCFK